MIDQLSLASILIVVQFNGTKLGSATGFILGYKNKHYLITNWHVVSGRNPITNKPLSIKTSAIPNSIYVWFNYPKVATNYAWIGYKEDLFDENGNKKWLEHPDGQSVDVVAFPIEAKNDATFMAYTLEMQNTPLLVSPSDPVSIIGFPSGKTSTGVFPIWKTGHIASELELDYDQKPIFLIDATTKEGMSGSPVVAKRNGMFQTTPGQFVIGQQATKFLGVYSGRDVLEDKTEIGLVWKPKVIEEILNSNHQ